jgi:DNA (cytosine-5)-methyltransferase 1
MAAYYNEVDGYCCDWLSNLMDAGLIECGEIDDRDIREVGADDVGGYERVHFFAGIAGWDCALDLAGWNGPVWTGSCPCQPFSAAGKGKAADDERHLWPAWFSLIRECRPAVVFGEQVEAAIGWGWLDAVFSDLEAEGYACGAAVLPACCVGAPHIRQRVWFVADADGWDTSAERLQRSRQQRQFAQDGRSVRVADAAAARLQGRSRQSSNGSGIIWGIPSEGSPWDDCDWLSCTDGKARPVEPGTFPLAHGIPGRVGRLRAYGNAIVPALAAEFIKAAMND